MASKIWVWLTADGPKYITVAILTFINLVNYMDRFTIAGILQELENKTRNGWDEDLDINDTLGGLLQTGFIVSYMLLSPFFGYLGDRYTRKYIISVGIFLWSAFTLAGSFAVNYWMLLATRLLVGIGEASYATIAPTMIADLFTVDKRLRMLSIFYLAIPVGSACGYVIGSGASQFFHDRCDQIVSWRWGLRVTPVLGVISVILVLLLVREPPRGHTDGQRSKYASGVKGKSGVSAYFQDLMYCLRTKTFVLSTLGFTSVAFITGALAQWAPLFIIRASKVIQPNDVYSETRAAYVFGGITVVAGILGTLSGSELSKLLGRYTRKAEAYVCAIGLLVGTPLLYVALNVLEYRNFVVAWGMVFLAEFFFCLNWAPVGAILLYSIIPARRSTAEAVQILFSHLFGDAISPTIIGGVSDAIYRSKRSKYEHNYARAVSMEYSFFITTFVSVLGGAAFLAASFTVERDRAAVENYTRSQNSKIRRGELGDDSSSSNSESEFDEHRVLLSDAINSQYDKVGT